MPVHAPQCRSRGIVVQYRGFVLNSIFIIPTLLCGAGESQSDTLEHSSDEVAHALLVVGVGFGVEAVCDNRADSHAAVPHKTAHAGKWRTFHFVVCHTASFVLEIFDAAVEVGIREGETHVAALRPIETYSRNCVAAHHVVTSDAAYKRFVGIHYIRPSPERIPAGVLAESAFEVEVGHFIAPGIVVEHPRRNRLTSQQ